VTEDLRPSRSAKVAAVTISSAVNGPDQLPIVALEVCVAAVDAAGLPHEHVIVGLSPAILDALDQARAALAELVVK
jgi:hypothetical protein